MPVRQRTWLVIGVAAAVVIGVAAAAGWTLGRLREPEWRGMAVSPPYPAADFVLTDQSGRPWQLAGQRGKPVLLFFGYTSCPDVCPATMLQFKAVREALGPDADRVAFVFVTVDPERDTPERLRRYLARFDPAIVGLTGSPEAVQDVMSRYGVFAEKVPVPGSSAGYLMNHTALTYLIGPDGLVRVMFAHGTPTDDIVHDVRLSLRQRPQAGRPAVRVENAWARPASAIHDHGGNPMMGATSAIYMTLVNTADEPDRLVAVRTDVADAAEIHETRMENHVMHMHPVDGVELPPKGRVELKPAGLHVMLIGLRRDLDEGDRLRVVLVFERAGQLPVDVEVRQAAP